MSDHNENSALVALRELRDMEKRRTREEHEARARAEAERLERMRADEARLALEQAEREAARQRTDEDRLRRELEMARGEASRLREQLAAVPLAGPAPVPAPAATAPRRQPVAWMAISLAATALACVLAIQPTGRSEPPTRPCPAAAPTPICPKPPAPAPVAPPAVVHPVVPPLVRPQPRPKHRPVTPPPASPKCDGTDPLCGLDTTALEDTTRRRRP